MRPGSDRMIVPVGIGFRVRPPPQWLSMTAWCRYAVGAAALSPNMSSLLCACDTVMAVWFPAAASLLPCLPHLSRCMSPHLSACVISVLVRRCCLASLHVSPIVSRKNMCFLLGQLAIWCQGGRTKKPFTLKTCFIISFFTSCHILASFLFHLPRNLFHPLVLLLFHNPFFFILHRLHCFRNSPHPCCFPPFPAMAPQCQLLEEFPTCAQRSWTGFGGERRSVSPLKRANRLSLAHLFYLAPLELRACFEVAAVRCLTLAPEPAVRIGPWKVERTTVEVQFTYGRTNG